MTDSSLRIAHVSAALALHPQTLRKYERAGLVKPARRGVTRNYSDADLERLALIKHMADVRRINVAGMSLILAIRDDLLATLEALEAASAADAAGVAHGHLRNLLAAHLGFD